MGTGNSLTSIPFKIDWKGVKELAVKHNLSAFILDCIEKLPSNKRPPKELLLEWIGEVQQVYVYCYDNYKRTIADLAEFYTSHGFKMMVLKGYACSLDWPKPEHRPCGDIDIWQFGKQKEADALVASEKGIKIDNSHHHHTVFEWNGFAVENHYDFINVHAHKSSAEIEKIFKELGKDDSYLVEVCGEKVCLPSPNLHALFLIRHMVSHFAAAEISLRNVLDWTFFVEKHTNEVDWKWLLKILDQYHMREFFNCINGICVDDFGFSASIFPEVRFQVELKENVLADIVEPVFGAEEPKWMFNRIIYKYRRWKGNEWKQTLCYNESRWESFRMGLMAKLLKPASI